MVCVITSGISERGRELGCYSFFFFQAEDGIRDIGVTGVQTCALPIWPWAASDPLAADLQRRGVPHLVATVRGETGVVGPLVVPGATGCLRCADLHRRDRDPRWPALAAQLTAGEAPRSEEHTSELQSRQYLVCRLLLEKKQSHSPPGRRPLCRIRRHEPGRETGRPHV